VWFSPRLNYKIIFGVRIQICYGTYGTIAIGALPVWNIIIINSSFYSIEYPITGKVYILHEDGSRTPPAPGSSLTIQSWSNGVVKTRSNCPQNNANLNCIPLGTPSGTLIVERADGVASEMGVTVWFEDDGDPADHPSSVAQDHVLTVGPGGSINTAIDMAEPGDLILVSPGTYEELVIMWKPLKLQGWGAASTTINAVKAPSEKIVSWRNKVEQLATGANPAIDVLPSQELGFGLPEPAFLFTEEGPGIIVLAKDRNPNAGNLPGFGLVDGEPNARIDGLGVTGADQGGAPFSFFVGTKTVLYQHGFEGSDAGWTHAQVATQDDWQRGAPQGKVGDPAAAFEGSSVWGNDLGPSGWNGAYTNNVENWLRSPVLDCSAAANVTLAFRRWLTVEAGQFDQAQVRVNGQVVWQNPTGSDLIDTSWVPVALDISSIAAGNASVQVEFRLKSDGGVTFGGWNLDAFELLELGPGTSGCPPPASYCTGKISSQLCTPTVGSSGTPSVSGGAPFLVTASQVLNQKVGTLFYGLGADSKPFQGATMCVQGPVKRTPVQNSGGNPPPEDCSGTFAFDFNVLIQSGTDPALVQGAAVYCQYWYRDPGDPAGFGTGLSNALSFTICP